MSMMSPPVPIRGRIALGTGLRGFILEKYSKMRIIDYFADVHIPSESLLKHQISRKLPPSS